MPQAEAEYRKWGMVIGENTSAARGGGVLWFLDMAAMDGKGLAEAQPSDTIRLFWWMMHALAFDHEVQQSGLVFVEDFAQVSVREAARTMPSKETVQEIMQITQGASPIRMKAFHMVHAPWWMSICTRLMKLAMSRKMRKRIQLHPSFDGVLASVGVDAVPSNVCLGANGRGPTEDRIFRRTILRITGQEGMRRTTSLRGPRPAPPPPRPLAGGRRSRTVGGLAEGGAGGACPWPPGTGTAGSSCATNRAGAAVRTSAGRAQANARPAAPRSYRSYEWRQATTPSPGKKTVTASWL